MSEVNPPRRMIGTDYPYSNFLPAKGNVHLDGAGQWRAGVGPFAAGDRADAKIKEAVLAVTGG